MGASFCLLAKPQAPSFFLLFEAHQKDGAGLRRPQAPGAGNTERQELAPRTPGTKRAVGQAPRPRRLATLLVYLFKVFYFTTFNLLNNITTSDKISKRFQKYFYLFWRLDSLNMEPAPFWLQLNFGSQ